ncbi:MAG: hypothetical protein KatS3mg102_1658 [Planctomycetota bacterium]|nr:MAG: hypothetical protein KatS3mg102_1658 [Planctomycetota bacterium]
MAGRHLVLFDGECVLCNGFVQFVLPRDPRGQFAFAPLGGETARRLLERCGRDPERLDTVVVVPEFARGGRRALVRSAAVLFVLERLGGPWRLVRLGRWLPAPLLDRAYDLLARWRYRLFGRRQCALPRPEYRERFLDG